MEPGWRFDIGNANDGCAFVTESLEFVFRDVWGREDQEGDVEFSTGRRLVEELIGKDPRSCEVGVCFVVILNTSGEKGGVCSSFGGRRGVGGENRAIL